MTNVLEILCGAILLARLVTTAAALSTLRHRPHFIASLPDHTARCAFLALRSKVIGILRARNAAAESVAFWKRNAASG